MAREPDARFVVHRITVALESSPHGEAALAAAIKLAQRLHADIEGLFVEDINLSRLAALPIARLVRFAGGGGPVEAATLKAELDREVARVERALESAARLARVQSAFSRVRGEVAEALLDAAERGDLLILGYASGALAPGERAGVNALAAAERARKSVLIVRPGTNITSTAIVLFDGTPGSRRALGAAAGIAADHPEALTVVLRAGDEATAIRLRDEAGSLLAHYRQPARYVVAPLPSLRRLCRRAHERGAGVLVISGDDTLLQTHGGYAELLNQTRCPVLLVR